MSAPIHYWFPKTVWIPMYIPMNGEDRFKSAHPSDKAYPTRELAMEKEPAANGYIELDLVTK